MLSPGGVENVKGMCCPRGVLEVDKADDGPASPVVSYPHKGEGTADGGSGRRPVEGLDFE